MVLARAGWVLFAVTCAACSVGEVPSGTAPPPDGPVSAIDGPPTTPIDGPPVIDPAMSYDMIIKPLVSSLGCLGCHPALNPPDLSAYGKLDAKYLTHPGSKSLLVTQGPHEGNPFFNDDQKKTVQDWLDSLPPS